MSRPYVVIPGSATHELPPLFVRRASAPASREDWVSHAAEIVESEEIIPGQIPSESLREQRKFDLAIRLADEYSGLLTHWNWGDSILEWIRQCEITFASQSSLQNILHNEIWPHAGRCSFVDLLIRKRVATPGVAVEKAVGLRLTFRQPPPINCFSDQFLFLLNSTVAGSAYHAWERLNPREAGLFPPHRFHFEVVELG